MNSFKALSKLASAAIAVIVWGFGIYLINAQFGACEGDGHIKAPDCDGTDLFAGFVLTILGFCGLVYVVGKFQLVRDFFAD